MNQTKEENLSSRQVRILESATAVFARYGYKKTSLDDVATAAGLSRQGIYLHFASKSELFRGVVRHFLEQSRLERIKVLTNKEIDVEKRLLEAFVVSHGAKVGTDNFQELFAAVNQLVGDVLHESETQFVAELTTVLKEAGRTPHWKVLGISAKQIAELLLATSKGIQFSATNSLEYRRQMKVAVQVICGC